MEKECLLRLEYHLSANEDIQKEIELLSTVGWHVVVDNDTEFNTVRQEWTQIITLRKRE